MKNLSVPFEKWVKIKNEDFYQGLVARNCLSNFTLEELVDLVERYSNGDDYQSPTSGRTWWVCGCYYNKSGNQIVIDREFISEYNNSEIIISPKGSSVVSNDDRFADFVNKALQQKLNKNTSKDDEGREI